MTDDDGTAYDPNDDTVSGVLATLAEASEPERARILAAETAGKGRVSILREYPEAGPDAEAPAPGDVVPPPESIAVDDDGEAVDGYTRVLVSSPDYPDSTPDFLASLAEDA